MKPEVFISRIIPQSGLDLIAANCEMDLWTDEMPPQRDELLERVRGKSGLLVTLNDKIDDIIFDTAGPQLEVVSNFAVGFDNIDVKTATSRGIPIGHTPGVLTETTADLAFALLLAAARRIVEGADFARSGKWRTWSPTLMLGRDVHRATLGILGMGRIGRAMLRRAAGFDMEVLYCDPAVTEDDEIQGARLVPFEELLTKSDFLSLHVPLSEETHHIIDEKALKKMNPGSALINTARGPIVDPDALYDALASGQIACAALDVTEPEPLPAGHRLYGLASCLIVPHVGSATVATRAKMATMAADNLLCGLRDEHLPNCVNPEVYT